MGALSKTEVVKRLERLDAVRRRLEDSREAPRVSPPRRLRQGQIEAAVVSVLSSTNRALRVGEVVMRVEARLGQPVSRDTVNSCMSTCCRGKKPKFRRVGVGMYRAV